jgi:hypothetical protein
MTLPLKGLTIERLQSFHTQMAQALYLSGSPNMPCAIAGGCVRDILCKKPIKDIDILITVSDWELDLKAAKEAEEEIEFAVERLNKLFCCKGVSKSDFHVEDPKHEGNPYKGATIAEVWSWKNGFNDMECDVLFVSMEPLGYIREAFDFGICQTLVGHYGLRTTPAFWKDYHNQTLTFGLEDSRRESSKEHLKRLLDKFSGWHPRNICL